MNEPLIAIKSSNSLLRHLRKTDPKKIEIPTEDFSPNFRVIRKNFNSYLFRDKLDSIDFKKCKFKNCTFENLFGFYLNFIGCTFENCYFKNSRFSHFDPFWEELKFSDCVFQNFQLDEGGLIDISFTKCNFIGLNIQDMDPLDADFNYCYLRDSTFDGFHESTLASDEPEEGIRFNSSEIEASYFNGIDLRSSKFTNATIYKSAFIDCLFKSDTIVTSLNIKTNYASIDFQSLLNSEDIEKNILKDYFNIHDPNIKATIKTLTSKIDFKTVFISYSFKDKVIAHLLNLELNKRGIKTFIWEKDAPGGQTLKEIMMNNIKKHDKILFIASQSSIKSEACQFELSEGRKKQNATWETVFFPIHIDDFLFRVSKNQIRPISKAEEYWENIEELKRINSIDCKSFDPLKHTKEELKNIIDKIIHELAL